MREVTGGAKRATNTSAIGEGLPCLLYVEDDPDNWAVTELRLSRRFRLFWARTDVEACALFRRWASELCVVLMDIELKGSHLSGLELTTAFRGAANDDGLPDFARGLPTSGVPIFFVTAHSARYPVQQLTDLGASRVITKPVNFAELSLALSELQLAQVQGGNETLLSRPTAPSPEELGQVPPDKLKQWAQLAQLPLLGGTTRDGDAVATLKQLSAPRFAHLTSLVAVTLLANTKDSDPALLENALRRAATAVLLGRELAELEPMEAALLGVLLDAGLLARSRHDANGAREVALSPARWRPALEHAAGEVEHPMRSGQVARRWGASSVWVEAIECHHQPTPPESSIGRLAWLTERAAGVFEAGNPALIYEEALSSAELIKVPRLIVERVLENLPNALEELAQTGGWKIGPSQPLRSLLLESNPTTARLFRSHGQLVRVLTQLANEKDGLVQRLTLANGELEKAAGTDALTGLANQRAFIRTLGLACAKVARSSEWISLILLDLDHFKRVNDTWGHPAGDEVLRKVGQVLRSAVRESDFAARCGGEEFAIIVPNNNPEAAGVLAERVRSKISSLRFDGKLDGLRVTASFGVASLCGDEPALDAEELIAEADRALYDAKAQGRDRVILATPSPHQLPS